MRRIFLFRKTLMVVGETSITWGSPRLLGSRCSISIDWLQLPLRILTQRIMVTQMKGLAKF